MKYTNNPLLIDLLDRAEKRVWEKEKANTTKTNININGKIYVEKAFSWCWRVAYTFSPENWREAKKLWCKKGYRDWSIGGGYYNGQFGDACSAYREILREFKQEFPQYKEMLDKIDIDTWID